MFRDVDLRIEAIRAAAKVVGPKDDIASLLVHAEWIMRYLLTGAFPETDKRQDSVVTNQDPVIAANLASAA